MIVRLVTHRLDACDERGGMRCCLGCDHKVIFLLASFRRVKHPMLRILGCCFDKLLFFTATSVSLDIYPGLFLDLVPVSVSA